MSRMRAVCRAEVAMTIENLSPEELDRRQQALLAAFGDDLALSNRQLRNRLGADWSEDVYWAVRNRLVEQGKLELGRGRGGIVRLVPSDHESAGTVADDDTHGVPPSQMGETNRRESSEAALYEPMAQVLRQHWGRERGFDAYVVEVLAHQGARATGGRWSRPDIVVVGYKTFPYVPGRFLEVVTFEVKWVEGADITAVYEALAHRRFATRAYVIVHVPDNRTDEVEAAIDGLAEEGKRHGIGVQSKTSKERKRMKKN